MKLLILILVAVYLIAGEVAKADQGTIVHLIQSEAMKQGLDPDVALAVAKIESSLNPKAVGALGEVVLFQIRHEFVTGYTRIALFDPKINAKVGIQQLLYYKKTCFTNTANTFVVCYNAGLNRRPKYPTLLPYYKKFQKALAENK